MSTSRASASALFFPQLSHGFARPSGQPAYPISAYPQPLHKIPAKSRSARPAPLLLPARRASVSDAAYGPGPIRTPKSARRVRFSPRDSIFNDPDMAPPPCMMRPVALPPITPSPRRRRFSSSTTQDVGVNARTQIAAAIRALQSVQACPRIHDAGLLQATSSFASKLGQMQQSMHGIAQWRDQPMKDSKAYAQWIGRYALLIASLDRNLHKVMSIASRIREHPGEAHGMGMALAQFEPKLDDICNRLAYSCADLQIMQARQR